MSEQERGRTNMQQARGRLGLPCLYCEGRRWYRFCGDPIVCGSCPEGKALLAEIARENDEEMKRRARHRAQSRRIEANRPRRFDLSLTREQLFTVAAAVEAMLDESDTTAAQRSALFGARRRIETAIGEAHGRQLAGRR